MKNYFYSHVAIKLKRGATTAEHVDDVVSWWQVRTFMEIWVQMVAFVF